MVEDNSHYGLLVGNKFVPFLKFHIQFLIVIESNLFSEIWLELGGFSTISASIGLVPDDLSSPMIGLTDPGFI